jgi:hypothetical protein
MADKPIFNKRIFWDVVFEDINYETKANFVIEGVFERGDVEDVRNCRRHYGNEKITEALLNSDFLSKRILYFASAIIDRPITDFKYHDQIMKKESVSF